MMQTKCSARFASEVEILVNSRMRALILATVAMSAVSAQARTYDIAIERQKVAIEPGRADTVVTLNGGVPGPVLRFTDGETATIRVTNRLKEPTSVHWHGLLLPGSQDGAPGFNNFAAIKPGETRIYTFNLRQTGTYWYHAHSATQEQAGQYGALIVDPKSGSDIAIKADRDQVVLLSEHTRTDPERILRNLKGDSGYYNFSKRTTPEFFADVKKFGFKQTLADRRAWGKMRMDPTDIADVGNYTLLVNGQPSAKQPSFRFTPGEKVRLRFINASAMSFMDVRMPGLTMTVVAADGRAVQPVKVDEFRMGVAETYDVIVEPIADQAYPLWVETLDRKASVLASFAPRDGMAVTAPAHRPRQVLLMSEMGSMGMDMGGGSMAGMDMGGGAMAGMDHSKMVMPASGSDAMAGMDHSKMAMPAVKPDAMAGMDHSKMAMPAAKPDAMAGMDHSKMAMPAAKPDAMAGMDHSKMTMPADTPDGMAGMDHSKMAMPDTMARPTIAGGDRVGTAVATAAGPGGTQFPVVDYGMGVNAMAGHGGMDMPALGREGDTDGSGRVLGWATGAPYGSRVLSVRDLVSLKPQADTRAPTRDIVIKVSGNMERYIWTLNGAKFGEAPPMRVAFNERVRVTFVNETMMAHPMHLHGMFFQVENGQAPDRMPDKNVVIIAPGRSQSIVLTANEAGEWPLHCHLLYHMESGMMQKLIVATVDQRDGTPASAMPGMSHGTTGGHR